MTSQGVQRVGLIGVLLVLGQFMAMATLGIAPVNGKATSERDGSTLPNNLRMQR